MARRKKNEPIDDFTIADTMNNIIGNKVRLKVKNDAQKEFAKLITDKEIVIASGPAGTGKAQPLNSDILTPKGWVKMGDVKVDDFIIGEDGKEHKIIEIHPQGEIDIYEVSFSDGTTTKCSGEHLWYTETSDDKPNKISLPKVGTVKTTIDIMNSLYVNNGHKNHMIPITKPVNFKHSEVKIDPYILGFLLSDGLKMGGVKLFAGDTDIIDIISERLEDSIKIEKISNDSFIYNLTTESSCNENPILTELEVLDLYNCKSEDRFIPKSYLFNSIEVRLDILRGLMDIDGTISSDGYHISYTSISKKLIDDVRFIIESLGGITHLNTKKSFYKYKDEVKIGCDLAYNLTLVLPPDINPFKLKRKMSLVIPKNDSKPKRYISNVNYIGKDKCQCISVNNPSNLYLTNNFIVTHNSYVSIARALELLYNKSNKLEKILIYKPAIEVEEKHGFLPGDLQEKIAPYVESSLCIVDKLIGRAARERMMMEGLIEIKALAYIRGSSIDNSILIMEEAQNMSTNQMKTLLTRIGDNSKFIISGDMDQSDRYSNIKECGLYDAMNRLKPVEDIGFFEFKIEDIVRNSIITKILSYYTPKMDDKYPKKELKKRIIPHVPAEDRAKLCEGVDKKESLEKVYKTPWWLKIRNNIHW